MRTMRTMRTMTTKSARILAWSWLMVLGALLLCVQKDAYAGAGIMVGGGGEFNFEDGAEVTPETFVQVNAHASQNAFVSGDRDIGAAGGESSAIANCAPFPESHTGSGAEVTGTGFDNPIGHWSIDISESTNNHADSGGLTTWQMIGQVFVATYRVNVTVTAVCLHTDLPLEGAFADEDARTYTVVPPWGGREGAQQEGAFGAFDVLLEDERSE